MKNIYTELALYGSKNECARTDTIFLPISEVCDGKVSLWTSKETGDYTVCHSTKVPEQLLRQLQRQLLGAAKLCLTFHRKTNSL